MAENDVKPSHERTPPTGEDSPKSKITPVEEVTKAGVETINQVEMDENDSPPSPNQQSKKKKKKKNEKKEDEGTETRNKEIKSKDKDVETDIGYKEGKTKANIETRKLSNQESKSEENDEVEKAGTEEGTEEEEEEGGSLPDLSNPELLDGKGRNEVYHLGTDYIKKGKKTMALKCFRACLTGMAESDTFSFLPQCLKHIADIYYSREEYEKAIQFIQAEKMYYENALICTSGLQKQMEENLKEKKDPEDKSTAPADDPEATRAEEYENLARLCLEKKQAELALEYQGKATKLRQQKYGGDHPLTKKSLDFFTVVYAEVGKQQYSESMQKFSDESREKLQKMERPPEVSFTQPRRRLSGILRTTSPTEESKHKDRHVRFVEPEVTERPTRAREESITRTVTWVLFAFCVVVLSALLLYLYCRLDPRSYTCYTWRSQMTYYYMRLKYIYYTWNSNPNNQFG